MAFAFDEERYEMPLALGPHGDPEFTVMGWMKVPSTESGSWVGLWNNSGSFPISCHVQKSGSDGEINFGQRDSDEDWLEASTSDGPYHDDDWHAIVARHWNGDTADLWVDWVQKDQVTNTAYDGDGSETSHAWGSAAAANSNPALIYRGIVVYKQLDIELCHQMLQLGRPAPVRGIWHEFATPGVQVNRLAGGPNAPAILESGSTSGFVDELPPAADLI